MKRFVRTVLPNIESLQQPVQLAAFYAEHLVSTLGPNKPVPLQPLLPEAKTVAVPVKDFDHVAAAVAEGKQVPAEGLQRQVHLHQQAQSVDGFAHVGGAHREEDLQMLRNHHWIPRSAVTTCCSVGGSNPGETSMQRSGDSATRRAGGIKSRPAARATAAVGT